MNPSSEILLDVRSIRAGFGGFIALDSVNLNLHKGELLGLIGTNGAGKSTLFSVITGHIRPLSGSVSFSGESIDSLAVHERVRRGLARTFQVPREFTGLSVFENMMVAAPNAHGEQLSSLIFRRAEIRRQREEFAEKATELLAFLNLAKVSDTAAGELSGGQKKLLELGRLLMMDPSCILLDEPFAGVNPVLIAEISERILMLNQSGIAVLIIEHNLTELARVVQRMYVMDRGTMLAEGAPKMLLGMESVREAYMGGML